jgi:hypothetical protein
MRRIYESSALRRDDDAPFTPNERDEGQRPQAARRVPATAITSSLLPEWVRHRAISVDVSAPATAFDVGDVVPFQLTMKNPMPFPVVIETASAIEWTWNVDGHRNAAHFPLHDPPDEASEIRFDRGERKRIRTRWDQMFRVSTAEWAPATAGEYTIGAGINVADSADKGLYDDVTVRLVRSD